MNAMVNTNELRAERIRQGKTNEYMAALIGKGFECYRKKERGEVGFTAGEMAAITNDLGFDETRFNVVFFDGKLPFGKKEN